MRTTKTLLFGLLLFFGFASGQSILTGKVTNGKNEPVEKVKIYIDSLDSKVETNRKGEFKVLLPENVSIINVYSKKYGLLSNKFNNETVMNFIYLESEKSIKDSKNNDDNVSIGYSQVDKKYHVNNVQSLNAEKDINTSTYHDIYDMIRGRLAGVSVSHNNKITIRGVSSIGNVSEPLFVVDGAIESSIEQISPNNVKTINVLRGSDASIYGSQASAGVIIITTK